MAAVNANVNVVAMLSSHSSRNRNGIPSHTQLGSSFSGAKVIPNPAMASHRPSFPRTCSVSALGQQPVVAAGVITFLKNLFPGLSLGGSSDSQRQGEEQAEEAGEDPRGPVLLVGGTGRTGRRIAERLMERGRAVVALVSSEERATQILSQELGLTVLPPSSAPLSPRVGSIQLVLGDISDSDAVARVLPAVSSVVCAIGSRFRPPSGDSPGGYVTSPAEMYGRDMPAFIRSVADAFAGRESGGMERVLFDFRGMWAGEEVEEKEKEVKEGEGEGKTGNGAAAAAGATNGAAAGSEADNILEGWRRFDDVIMGGKSGSEIIAWKGCALYRGFTRVDGGGFSSVRALFPCASVPCDLSAYEGIRLWVRGDGQRYKMNIRDVECSGEFQYQASFDTVRGQWVDVHLPWDKFVPVARSKAVLDAKPLDPSRLTMLGLVHSRFQNDGFPNPLFQEGDFSLEIACISAFSDPTPQFVLVSSAAVQRSARAVTAEEREASIPIVKLNPAGVLSWKLGVEDLVRASGLRYTVVRPCGLINSDNPTLNDTYLLESGQGDVLVGLVSPREAGQVCAEAVGSPDAVNKTFEVRRDDLTKGLQMEQRHWLDLFRRLRPDVPGQAVQYPAVPKEMADAFEG